MCIYIYIYIYIYISVSILSISTYIFMYITYEEIYEEPIKGPYLFYYIHVMQKITVEIYT